MDCGYRLLFFEWLRAYKMSNPAQGLFIEKVLGGIAVNLIGRTIGLIPGGIVPFAIQSNGSL